MDTTYLLHIRYTAVQSNQRAEHPPSVSIRAAWYGRNKRPEHQPEHEEPVR